MPSPHLWVGLGEGLRGGLDAGRRALEMQRMEKERLAIEQERRDARTERERERLRQEEMDRLQRRQLEAAITRQPMLDARSDLETNIKVKGLESTLNDPATLELTERAGVTFDRRPVFKPEWTTPATLFTGDTITPEQTAKIQNRGLFEKTGIVKPPEVVEKEAERELAIQRARQVSTILGGLSSSMLGGGGFQDTPANRLGMRLGLGLNANEILGPIRETPEDAAAKAAAEAKARLPIQKELLDYAKTVAGVDVGDPYFNQALTVLSGFFPPVDGESAQRLVGMASELAKAAQAASPRGRSGAMKPPAAPAQVPGGGAPPAAAPGMDQLIQQAVSNFGGLDKAIEASKDPAVQQRLRAAGIDPAAYIRRMTAMKIMENLANLQTQKK